MIQADAPLPSPPVSLTEALRALPLGIQGTWLGLVCIVLLVGSAAALRSLFESNVGAASPLVPSASASVASAPSGAATSAPGAAAHPTAEPTATSLSIGGGSGGPGGPGGPGAAGFGALAIRDRMATSIRMRQIGPFLNDLDRLMEIEPSAIDRADMRKMIADAAMYSMVAGPGGVLPPESERIFTFLTMRAGPAGPDILFDLVTTRGGSRAATHAEELLRREDVRAKGTPAFRIAWDLRVAPTCDARVALFDRAKTDGDRRVLAALFLMSKCGKGPSDCCLSNDPGYKEVVRVITSKK